MMNETVTVPREEMPVSVYFKVPVGSQISIGWTLSNLIDEFGDREIHGASVRPYDTPTPPSALLAELKIVQGKIGTIADSARNKGYKGWPNELFDAVSDIQSIVTKLEKFNGYPMD